MVQKLASDKVGVDPFLQAEPTMPHHLPTRAPGAFGIQPTAELSDRFVCPAQRRSLRWRRRALLTQPQQLPFHLLEYPGTAALPGEGSWGAVPVARRPLQHLAQLQQP